MGIKGKIFVQKNSKKFEAFSLSLIMNSFDAQVAPIYWCSDVRSPNILVLLVLAAPIGEDTQTFHNLKNFADFLNVCRANILVLTGLQHQYIGAVQGESIC